MTPTLFVGDVPDGMPNAYRASTVGEALMLIRDGLVAVLPEYSWDEVEQVVRVLNPNHDQAALCVERARAGRFDVSIETCRCPSCLAFVTRPRRETNGALIFYDD